MDATIDAANAAHRTSVLIALDLLRELVEPSRAEFLEAAGLLKGPAASAKKEDDKTFESKGPTSWTRFTQVTGMDLPQDRRKAWAVQAAAVRLAVISGTAPPGLGDPEQLVYEAKAQVDAKVTDAKKNDAKKRPTVQGWLRHFRDSQYFILAVCTQEHDSPAGSGTFRTDCRLGGVIDESGTRRQWDYAASTMYEVIDLLEQ